MGFLEGLGTVEDDFTAAATLKRRGCESFLTGSADIFGLI
jgi:hypothetical protein